MLVGRTQISTKDHWLNFVTKTSYQFMLSIYQYSFIGVVLRENTPELDNY